MTAFDPLVSAYRFTEDWASWERHPAGDELVFQLAGALDVTRGEGTENRSKKEDT